MSLARRNAIFILGLVFMVCALNFGIYVLSGSDFKIDEYNKESVPLLVATLIAGPLAIGFSGYMTTNGKYRLNAGKTDALKAGLISVLWSYVLLGFIIWVLSIAVLPFMESGMTSIGVGVFAGGFFGFGAMIVAFMVSAWIAIPLASGWALLLSSSEQKEQVTNHVDPLRLIVFSLLIFIAAIWVSHQAIPFKDNIQSGFLNETTLLCGFVSAFAAALSWFFCMDKGESRIQGARAGITTALVAVCLIGPAMGMVTILHDGNLSLDTLFEKSAVAAIFSFFAILLASWNAIPISILIGFLVARTSSQEREALRSPKSTIKYWHGFDKQKTRH